jgi:hypothetical protein
MKHQHKYIATGEYISTGKNLVGKTVSAVIEKVVCTDPECQEDNIRIKQGLGLQQYLQKDMEEAAATGN